MKKITLPVKIWSLITGFFLFTIIFSTASTSGISGHVITVEDQVNVLCPAHNDGSITVSVTGGTIYTYQWTKNGSIYPTVETTTLNNLTTGIYQVTVTDVGDNSTTTSVPIEIIATDSEAPVISVSDIIASADSGVCSANFSSPPAATASDNCSVVVPTGSRSDNLPLTDPYPVGITTITWEAIDANGNIGTAEQAITITDDELPVITTQDINLECAAAIDFSDAAYAPAATDNCSVGQPVGTRDDGLDLTEPFPYGSTTITWEVTDVNGNAAVPVDQVVTITDDQAPNVATQNITVELDASGVASITPSEVDNGTTDNCSFTLTLDKDTFDCSEIGIQTVVLTATDGNGNTASAPAQVTVEDTSGPIVLTKNITMQLDENGLASISTSDIDNGSTDNCQLDQFALDFTDFDCSNIGDNTVTLTVSDVNGNTNFATATVTIEDSTVPVIDFAPSITQGTDAGSCEATVTITEPATSDNCSVGNPVGTRDDGNAISDPYPIGTTIITWNVNDVNGNPAEAVRQVITIQDDELPQVPVLPEISTSCEITLTPPQTTDNCSTAAITGTTDDPTTYLPQNNLSEHIINWRFEDNAGNVVFAEQKLIIDPIITTITTSAVTCNGGNDGSIQVDAIGGQAPYTYALNNGSFSSSSTFTDISAGTYFVKVKDATGCIREDEITITEPGALQYTPPASGSSTTTTPESCFEAFDGAIQVNGTITGGTGIYEYSVDNITFTSNPITGLASGDYEVFIQDSNGCRLSQVLNATVAGPDELAADIDYEDASCYQTHSGSITISNPSGGNSTPYSFRLNGGTWQTNSTPTGYQFTGLAAGTYVVEMKDNSGCSKELTTISITEPDALIPNITTTRTTTYGSTTGTATADPTGGNGGYNYQWKDPSGNVFASTKTVTGLRGGTYELTVRDAEGCTVSENFTIFDAVTAEISAISVCMETDDTIRTSTFQVDLEQTQGGDGEPYTFNYSWDFGEGASLPPGTTGIGPFEVSYSTIGDKTITLTVTDQSGTVTVHTFQHYVGECFETCDSSKNFEAYNDSFYIGDINGVKMKTDECDDNTPMYIWFIVSKSSNVYRLYSEFIYTISTATSTKQYKATNCFEKLDSNGVPLQVMPGDKVRLNQIGTGDNQINWKCDEVLNLIHITYKWTNNNTKACGDTERNMCASSNQTIAVATPIRAYAEASSTCKDTSNGSIIIYAFGGTGEFDFEAHNNDTGVTYTSSINVFNDLPAGNYTVTVTDKKEVAEELGQEKNTHIINDVIVNEPDEALLVELDSQNISCFGEQNGWAEVKSTSGGVAPYTYLWNDARSQTTMRAENLSPGNYTVTITDSWGCTVVKSVDITQPPALTVANAGADQTRCGFTSTNLEANTATSGTGRWEIVYQPAGSTPIIDDPSNPTTQFTGTDGKYELTWTISNADGSCYSEDKVVINIIEDCNYLDFDGLDDYIDFGPEAYNFDTGSYSMEAWVKLKSTSGTRTILSKKDYSSTLGEGYELAITSGGVPTFKVGGVSIFPNSSVPLNTQRWYHIAVTYDGTVAKLFVDGLQVNSLTVNNPKTSSAPFFIGATYDSSSNRSTRAPSHFNGWIEEVRLWKKALTAEQLRFMMNQRLEKGALGADGMAMVKGTELPMEVPGPLSWNDLDGYYQLLALEAADGNGTTLDLSNNAVPGVLKNITTFQENTAPLPYVSKRDGNWRDIEPSTSPWKYARGRWDAPNSLGINQKSIDWNIVRTSHNLISGNKNITVLALLSEENLAADGSLQSKISVYNPNQAFTEYNGGHSLRVTHYLKLNGAIDLVGESQLLQDEGSILEETSSGYIERDQQGTASSFNYNYWSSPVSPRGGANNADYTVASVLRDGTDHTNPGPIDFNYQYHYADWGYTGPKRISTYWLYKYTNFKSNTYAEWLHVGQNGNIKAGEGFTMKGTSGSASIQDRQNLTFIGKPNNGTIKHVVNVGNDYLVGNPYPSAIDSHKFISDNIKDAGGNNSQNVFNGTLYFWDHFAGKTHYLQRYIGGYATLNLSGGIEAIANDERINATGDRADASLNPKRYIPVGQAFYVSTQLNGALAGLTTVEGGEIIFKNSQRVFETEHQIDDESIFKSKKEKEEAQKQANEDKRAKIYLRYISPEGFQRQILVTRDSITSTGFDLGYDAPLIENIDEDMYWAIHDVGFVIQAVPDFNTDRELPLIVKVHQEGEFSIKIDKLENIPADLEIHLKDSLSETTYDLRKSDFKTVEPEGSIKGRFSLVFPQTEIAKEVTEENNSESINSYYSSKETKVTIENPYLIPIQSAILYNINGQKLSEYGEVPVQQLYEIPIGERASGVYILKLQMEEESKSVKFVVD
ncbi:LamG-like jellyroll fold domain-containing protein [Salinimicrobium gaetbulicola]|uniref:LamG-like jellyroll fold domain-containing protein n=1 Tax=Salinimicrobium gaetbulicola TaxID=999702 RepID=A0ABW3IG15_9FLAO